MTLYDQVARFKADVIARTLRECDGVRSIAAKRLGVERTYLARLVRELGVDAPPPVAGWVGNMRARRVRAELAASALSAKREASERSPRIATEGSAS